ncbi:sensor histidine kinase [Poseidonibacter antarcticus]|uniref:sensor histidine kinase n=1 Tax=Poseidonibacter antarcticus TaxID=2478538 RepID=UPI000EF47C9F|nr:sensor histidine kinase [Poseidonibacter antarcticus]
MESTYKNTISIKSRLIKWLIFPFALLSVILFIYIYLNLQEKVNSFFDNRLFATAQSIKENIGIENSKLFIDLPNFSIDLLSNHEQGLVYYSVVNEEGELLIGHGLLFNKRILINRKKRFYNLTYDGVKLRAVSYKTTLNSAGKIHTAYITIGETTEEREENINYVLTLMFIIMAIVIFFTITITIIAVNKGLKPLNNLKKIIKKRDDRDLEPLVFNAPKELEDIVNSINILLSRSRDTIDYIEQFNSDISHQLRTPLAEMKVKIQLHYEKNSEDFIALNSLLNNMTHITEQLLLYAKTNPNTINLKRFEKRSLNQLCKEYCLRTAPRVYAKGFEFAFENIDEEVFIQTDSILLESMMDNIINNTIHYAIDENGNPIGTITLSLERHNNTVWLNIKDEGKGVPKQNLKSIFERYYRVDSSKQGSGLGLSIVKQIAVLHQAKVLASNENGLKISIVFNHKEEEIN